MAASESDPWLQTDVLETSLQHVCSLSEFERYTNYLQTFSSLSVSDCIQSELDLDCLETNWRSPGGFCNCKTIESGK